MLTLDIIEARAKALGWRTSIRPFLGVVRLEVAIDAGVCVHHVAYYTRDGEVVRCLGHDACRHDLAALESPEPARPVVDPVTGLMPCPFCGGKATVSATIRARVAECRPCKFRLIRFAHGSFDAKGAIRAAWNSRTP